MLAGGAGSRLGGEKASANLRGRPLSSYPVKALSEAGLAPVVIAKRHTELPDLGVDVLRETFAATHPLAGIVFGLREFNVPILVCGCDMPFVTAALAAFVAGIDEQLVVPEAGGRLQPLFARYAPELLGPLERGLAQERPLTSVVEELGPRVVAADELGRYGDPVRLLANINRPEELAEAEAILS